MKAFAERNGIPWLLDQNSAYLGASSGVMGRGSAGARLRGLGRGSLGAGLRGMGRGSAGVKLRDMGRGNHAITALKVINRNQVKMINNS